MSPRKLGGGKARGGLGEAEGLLQLAAKELVWGTSLDKRDRKGRGDYESTEREESEVNLVVVGGEAFFRGAEKRLIGEGTKRQGRKFSGAERDGKTSVPTLTWDRSEGESE